MNRNWVAKVGGLRWLMIAILLLVQVHFCPEKYVLPSGLTCVTCPTLEDHSENASVIASNSHGDCHDCCTIQGCSDEPSPKVADKNQSKIQLVLALHAPEATLDIPFLSVTKKITGHVEGCPATGPPSTQSSRAPPVQQLA